MAIITMPAVGIASVKYEIDNPAQVNRSDWTGATGILLQSCARWYANVVIVPGNAAMLLPWRGFMASVRGRVNSFVLNAVEAAQTTAGLAAVDGAGQSGFNLALKNLPPSTMVLPFGSKIHVAGSYTNWQLFELTSALVSNSAGKGTATLGTPIRTIFPDGAGVELATPGALMRMSGTRNGWTVEPGKSTPGSFDCEEDY